MDEVKLNHEDEPRPESEIQPELEIQPVPEPIEPQAEMPEDFEDPEGKSGKWKTVKGEVEVEGKKVEVFYREKVIELPKYRQEETGIKRIRRRELLPPFPEGLYLSSDDRLAEALKVPWMKEGEYKDKEDGKIWSPAYNGDETLDGFYNFLTDGKYPRKGIYVHAINYIDARNKRIKKPDINGSQNSTIPETHKFMQKGLYFQKIREVGLSFDLYPGRIYPLANRYINPVFIFDGSKGSPLDKNTYLQWYLDRTKEMGGDVEKSEVNLAISTNPDKPLRWCHAECALVPTKRSLNVLFFETGDEDKNGNAKEEK